MASLIFNWKRVEAELRILKQSSEHRERQFSIQFSLIYPCRHLYQRVEEHKSSAVGVHFKNCHKSVKHFDTNFTVLRQCKTKFDCLVYDLLFIKELKPSLNVQSDSLKAKLF